MEQQTTVVNLKNEEYDVYIGRPSKWGNPFVIGKHGTREEVLKLYKEHIVPRISKPELMKLKGKRLGCYCKPLACHGDILVQLINNTNLLPTQENAKHNTTEIPKECRR